MNGLTLVTCSPGHGWGARRRRTAGAVISIVALAATMSGCVSTEGAKPSASAAAPVKSLAAAPPETGAAAPFAVPVLDGPLPQPITGGTTHFYDNPGTEPHSDYRRIEYTIPAGWEVGEVYIGKNLGRANEVALSFWTTEGLYPDPCRRSDSELIPLDLAAHTHDDTTIVLLGYPAHGLSAQRGRTASEPRVVMLDHPAGESSTPALRVALSVPLDLDVTSCEDGVYSAWPSSGAGDPGNRNHVAGQTDIVYQVDVDLAPLLIDASYRPDSSPDDIEELYSVLGSIVFHRHGRPD